MNPKYEAAMKYMKAGEYGTAWECVSSLYDDAVAGGARESGYKVVRGFRKAMKALIEEKRKIEEAYDLLHRSYVKTAVDYFDDFMIAVEWERPIDARFWAIRREKLLPYCEEMQKMEEGMCQELFLSQAPRTGKTTEVMFYVIWKMLKYPERPNLYSSYSDTVVKVFFKGVLEILQDEVTYRIKDVFPNFVIASVDSKDLLINIGRKRKYATLTCRSVEGTLNGACDVNGGLLIADDLHSGYLEVRSKDQLIKKWGVVKNNLLPRAIGKYQILWIGTRWSLYDCISMRLEMLENDPDCAFIKYKVFNVPALNANDESNFDYDFHKGYTTEQLKAIRASFERSGEIGMFLAQYQGTPIEMQGAVFEPEELRYYNGILPLDASGEPIEPDRRYIVVDPAWGGGDYVAAVVVFQYGDDLYVPAVVFNNGDKSVTQPEIAQLAIKYNVQALYVEATRVTMSFADELDKRLRSEGFRLNINGSVKNWSGQQGKQQRIYDKAPEIRERFVFLDKTKWNKVYTMFMQNVFMFVAEGKNKHDDAPDVLAMTLVNAFRVKPKIQAVSASILDRF